MPKSLRKLFSAADVGVQLRKAVHTRNGEPFEPENQRALVPFLKRVRTECPNKDIWCFSGYTLDGELMKASRARCECTDEMLSLIDVLVDGRYVEALRNLALTFRGSENQRIIDLNQTRKQGKIVLWEEE